MRPINYVFHKSNLVHYNNWTTNLTKHVSSLVKKNRKKIEQRSLSSCIIILIARKFIYCVA